MDAAELTEALKAAHDITNFVFKRCEKKPFRTVLAVMYAQRIVAASLDGRLGEERAQRIVTAAAIEALRLDVRIEPAQPGDDSDELIGDAKLFVSDPLRQ